MIAGQANSSSLLTSPRVAEDVKRLENVVDLSSEWDFEEDGYVDKAKRQRSVYEMMIRDGLTILNDLFEQDVQLRERLFDKSADISEEAAIIENFRQWLKVARRVSAGVVQFHLQHDMPASNSEQLTTAIRRVESILTDDAEFFRGDALVQLRDAAVDSFRSGQCEQPRG